MPYRRGLFIILVAFIITLNLLPAWNIHIVPESWRKAFHFRYAWLVRETEHEIWSNTNRTPEQKKEEALALKKHFRPRDSIVAGKIRLLGYYSGLRVYDRNGLVDKRVWMRHSSRKLGTPGHDIKVSTDFFFPDDPTIVAHGRITGKTQHELLQKIKSQAPCVEKSRNLEAIRPCATATQTVAGRERQRAYRSSSHRRRTTARQDATQARARGLPQGSSQACVG